MLQVSQVSALSQLFRFQKYILSPSEEYITFII